MNSYITGSTVKRLREAKGMTQAVLAEKLCVSSKAVSKWETGKGLPDITLVEPLAKALGVSVMELMSGDTVTNKNKAGNMLRSGSMSARSAEISFIRPETLSLAAAESHCRR